MTIQLTCVAMQSFTSLWQCFAHFKKDIFIKARNKSCTSQKWNVLYRVSRTKLNLRSCCGVSFSPVSWYTLIALRSTSCLLCSIQSQGHNLNWRGGVHLRYLCHVLHPCQLCPLPHPREGEQSQASAICQRSKPSCLLVGQFCLGHGKHRLHQSAVSPLNWS